MLLRAARLVRASSTSAAGQWEAQRREWLRPSSTEALSMPVIRPEPHSADLRRVEAIIANKTKRSTFPVPLPLATVVGIVEELWEDEGLIIRHGETSS